MLASFFLSASGAPAAAGARHSFLWILAFATFGLCGWELVQTRSDRFVFDGYDMLATGMGSSLAYRAFVRHARRFSLRNKSAAPVARGNTSVTG